MNLSEIRNSIEYYEKKAKVPDQLPVDIADYKYLLELLDEGAELLDGIFQKRYLKWCPYCGQDQPILYGNHEHKSYCELNEWLEAVRDE